MADGNMLVVGGGQQVRASCAFADAQLSLFDLHHGSLIHLQYIETFQS